MREIQKRSTSPVRRFEVPAKKAAYLGDTPTDRPSPALSALVLDAMGAPSAAQMHLLGESNFNSCDPNLFYRHAHDEETILFPRLLQIAKQRDRNDVAEGVYQLLEDHAAITNWMGEQSIPTQMIADHALIEDGLIWEFRSDLAPDMFPPSTGKARTGIDISLSPGATSTTESAQKDLNDAKAKAEAYLAQMKATAAQVEKDGQALKLDESKSDKGAKGDIAGSLQRANDRDEQGYKDARAALTKAATTIGPLLATFPPAAIAFGAAYLLALGMMEALKAIGLEKLRVGRGRDAYTQEWIDKAGADADTLRNMGVPFPMYDEGQHVSPKEYASDYLEAQVLAPIQALTPDVRKSFDAGADGLKRYRDKDPVVAMLYAKAGATPWGWPYYAFATNEKALLTYSQEGNSPDTMIDALTVVAMRDAHANVGYFGEIRRAAETAWNLGIAEATPGSGTYHYGRGAQAFARAWDAARATAETHRDTEDLSLLHTLESNKVPIGVGALGAVALVAFGAPVWTISIPVLAGAFLFAKKKKLASTTKTPPAPAPAKKMEFTPPTPMRAPDGYQGPIPYWMV